MLILQYYALTIGLSNTYYRQWMIYSFPRTLGSNKRLAVLYRGILKRPRRRRPYIRSVGNFQCRTVVIETLSISTDPPPLFLQYTV